MDVTRAGIERAAAERGLRLDWINERVLADERTVASVAIYEADELVVAVDAHDRDPARATERIERVTAVILRAW